VVIAVPLGHLPAAQIDQLRRLIGESLQLVQFPVRPRIAVSGEPLRDQCINKHPDMFSRVLGHVFGMVAELLKEVIYGVLPVKELPHEDARGVQAKTSETKTCIGIEENGPVVKLLPKHDERVGYGFFSVFHRTDTGSLWVQQNPCQQAITHERRLGNRVCRAVID
jgi:hypothetical protein